MKLEKVTAYEATITLTYYELQDIVWALQRIPGNKDFANNVEQILMAVDDQNINLTSPV